MALELCQRAQVLGFGLLLRYQRLRQLLGLLVSVTAFVNKPPFYSRRSRLDTE